MNFISTADFNRTYKCINCGGSISADLLSNTNYYYCKTHYDNYICLNCYNKGSKKCVKCGLNLHLYDFKAIEKYNSDNGIMM
jgi:hypothetical protein